MYYNDYLAHYGVKGMKWGVRRKRQRADRNRWKSMSKSERAANRDSLNPRYKKLDREIDTDLYGERGVQRINRRMNKGQSHLRATTTEAARQTALGMGVGIGVIAVANPQLIKAGASFVNNKAKSKAWDFANDLNTKRAARRAKELIPKLVSDNSMNNVIKLKKNQYKVW